jgi:hypothetical protein
VPYHVELVDESRRLRRMSLRGSHERLPHLNVPPGVAAGRIQNKTGFVV